MTPTDLSALEKLAREAIEQTRMFDHSSLKLFNQAASPTTILAMIERIRELEKDHGELLEIKERLAIRLHTKIESLTKANEIMKSALEFYGNPDLYLYSLSGSQLYFDYGACARAALDSLGKGE